MASSEPVCFSSSHLVLSIEEELAKDPKIKVPERYIRVDQDPPSLETPAPNIPTIDMEQLASLETKDFELEKLHEGCKEWGLFQVNFFLNYLLFFCFQFIHLLWNSCGFKKRYSLFEIDLF